MDSFVFFLANKKICGKMQKEVLDLVKSIHVLFSDIGLVAVKMPFKEHK